MEPHAGSHSSRKRRGATQQGIAIFPHPAALDMSAEEDEIVEQTLHVAQGVSVYQIPIRGPTGHVSGEWRITDRSEFALAARPCTKQLHAPSTMLSPLDGFLPQSFRAC